MYLKTRHPKQINELKTGDIWLSGSKELVVLGKIRVQTKGKEPGPWQLLSFKINRFMRGMLMEYSRSGWMKPDYYPGICAKKYLHKINKRKVGVRGNHKINFGICKEQFMESKAGNFYSTKYNDIYDLERL